MSLEEVCQRAMIWYVWYGNGTIATTFDATNALFWYGFPT